MKLIGWFLTTFALSGLLLALLYRKLTTDPAAAVAGYRFLNRFDDETSYNLNENHYSTGPFGPVHTESSNIPTKVLSGAIPKDLSGLFLRNGPNLIPEKIAHGYHWFDGDGMLHSLRVKDGNATYSNQYIETPNYLLSKRYKGAVSFQIGELKGIIGLLKVLYIQFILSKATGLSPLQAGQANTAVNFYQNRIFLGYEANFPFEIAWQEDNTFRSLGYEDYNHTLNYPVTAHPKVDPEDGHLYFNGYFYESEYTMKYGKLRGDQVTGYFDIPLKSRIFAHDMSITKNYVVLYDSSIVFDETEMFKDGAFYKMDHSKLFRIGLLPKTATNGNETLWFPFDRAYGVVHAFNAWEEPETNEVVVMTPLYTSFIFHGRDAEKETLLYRSAELRMNLVTKETKVTFLDSENDGEFPNVHPAYLGRKTRFGFAAGINRTIHSFDKIVKYEFSPEKREVGVIRMAPGYVCGEPVIISRDKKTRRGKKEEDFSDSIYLAVFAIHQETLETHWLLFDGETMKEEPVVKLSIPGKTVPLGFHGLWIHEQDLEAHLQEQRHRN